MLIFDAQYDAYRGVVLYVRVKEGKIRAGQHIYLMHTGINYTVEEVGISVLARVPTEELGCGAVGYIIAGVKSVRDITIGDTITDTDNPASEPLPGYKEAKPVVFSSMYPIDASDYDGLQRALEKLAINDAALSYEKDSSSALGYGYRCGFLGLLHLEVVQERLEREFDLALLLSAPSVKYKIKLKTGEWMDVDNPTYYPDPSTIEMAEEPYIRGSIWIPERYLGTMMELCRDRRGVNTTFSYLAQGRVELVGELPLAEVLFDFYDRLKSLTQGYGSFDYEITDYRPTSLVKVDILVNGEQVDALSQLTHEERSRQRALHYCEKLEETIPRQQFKIAIQGVDRRQNHRPHHHQRLPQGRDRQVLRRRHLAQAQAAREAERRQETHEDGRLGGDPAAGLHRGAEDGSRQVTAAALPRPPASTSTSPSARRSAPTAISRSGKAVREKVPAYLAALRQELAWLAERASRRHPATRSPRCWPAPSTPSTWAAAPLRCCPERAFAELVAAARQALPLRTGDRGFSSRPIRKT